MGVYIDRLDPWRIADVDQDFKALHVSKYPMWEVPRHYSFTYSAITLSHATTSYAFAMRNSSPGTAKVIRYMSFSLTETNALAPAAAIEYGMDLFMLRRWTSTVAPGSIGTAFSVAPADPFGMPRAELPWQQSATKEAWDLRLPLAASSTTVINANDQFELDDNPILATRGWHLAANAAVDKTVDFMEYNARDEGLFPITLEQWEGIGLRPAVNTWANLGLTIVVEWDEVLIDELPRGFWSSGRVS